MINLTPSDVATHLAIIGMTKVELGKRIGVTPETLRLWQRQGCKGPGAIALRAFSAGWRP